MKAKTKKMIAIVDDSADIRYLLKSTLEKEGYDVCVVESGLRLIVLLKSIDVDLILLDINLPWLSGVKICKSIRQDNNLQHVKVIYISGELQNEEELYKTGCYDIILKPFRLKKLIDTVNTAVNAS